MTLDEIRKVLEEKCVTQTKKNVYTYDNVEFMVKSFGEKIVKADKVEIKEKYLNACINHPNNYVEYVVFYFNGEKICEISIYEIVNLSYINLNVDKELSKEEPNTIEQTLDKFYEELIKPFIIKVAKDIYKEIKGDK